MRRYEGRCTRTDPHAPPPPKLLEPLAGKVCERLQLRRESVRFVDDRWLYLRDGEWVEVPWYVYCVDPARER